MPLPRRWERLEGRPEGEKGDERVTMAVAAHPRAVEGREGTLRRRGRDAAERSVRVRTPWRLRVPSGLARRPLLPGRGVHFDLRHLTAGARGGRSGLAGGG